MAKIVFESEAELEEMIFAKQQDGFCPVLEEHIDDCFRQHPLGSYGITDLIAVQYEVIDAIGKIAHFIIYEIKKEVIKADAVAQLSRYMTGMNHILSESWPEKYGFTVRGALVAPEIELSGDTCFLINQSEDIELYTVDWSMSEGVKFENRGGWKRSDSNPCSKTMSLLDCVKSTMDELVKQQPKLEVCK